VFSFIFLIKRIDILVQDIQNGRIPSNANLYEKYGSSRVVKLELLYSTEVSWFTARPTVINITAKKLKMMQITSILVIISPIVKTPKIVVITGFKPVTTAILVKLNHLAQIIIDERAIIPLITLYTMNFLFSFGNESTITNFQFLFTIMIKKKDAKIVLIKII
jgi:hypothetical protein